MRGKTLIVLSIIFASIAILSTIFMFYYTISHLDSAKGLPLLAENLKKGVRYTVLSDEHIEMNTIHTGNKLMWATFIGCYEGCYERQTEKEKKEIYLYFFAYESEKRLPIGSIIKSINEPPFYEVVSSINTSDNSS